MPNHKPKRCDVAQVAAQQRLPLTPEPALQIDRPAPTQTPRAIGALRIGVKAGNRLDAFRQSGASKAFFPRTAAPGLTGVILNTAGGITGGDRFAVTAEVAADSHLTLTSQTAERIYKAQPGLTARVSNDISIAAGGRCDWLPQETILFNRANIARRLVVDMACNARFVGVETMVFGRALMGEVIRDATWREDIRITRGGDLVYADAIAMQGDLTAQMANRFVGCNAVAMASVICVAPDADAYLSRLRAMMPDAGGVTMIRDGVIFARILAADSFDLRRALIPILTALRGPLPTVWTM